MPRGFTEKEKNNIRTRLLSAGMDLFGSFGVKKTNVEELANKAGISKGAFYQFFESKEDLYFSIIRNYEAAEQSRMYDILSGESKNDRTMVKSVISEMLIHVDNEPFLRRLLEKKELQYLQQKFSPEQLEEAMQADFDFAEQLVQVWRQKGILKIDDPELIAGIFRAIFFLFLHKEDIGEEKFPVVVDLFLDSAIEKIIKE